jgi:hypothetical protein
MICREPFDEGTRDAYDHPLATHFEEPDALLIFDDVLVPWDRVFLHGNVDLANRMYTETALRNHTAHQTGARAIAKMQLAVGVAMRVAETVKANGFLHVQEMLGEAIGYIELAKSCVIRSEVEFETTAAGTIRAGFTPLQTLRGLMSKAYPRIIEILQTVGAGGLLMMPTAADFASEVGDDVRRYYRGAGDISSEDRESAPNLGFEEVTRKLRGCHCVIGDVGGAEPHACTAGIGQGLSALTVNIGDGDFDTFRLQRFDNSCTYQGRAACDNGCFAYQAFEHGLSF